MSFWDLKHLNKELSFCRHPSIMEVPLKNVRFILITFILLVGCQKNPSQRPQEPSQPPALQTQSLKNVKTQIDSQTGLKITTEEVAEKDLSHLKNTAQMTSLSPFPISPHFNLNLFTLDQKEYRDFVFIAPKIYAFSTTDGARISILENDDGTVSIPFHAILVSGMQDKVSGTATNDLIQLPENYLARDIEKLKTEFQSRGRSHWALLPGCPKSFTLKVVDREFDVTPKNLTASDHCDLSKPFTLALRTTKMTAQYILQKALYDSTVDLHADFQTMVPYLISKINVEFDKEKIYDELDLHFKYHNRWIASAEARSYLEKIMTNQLMNVDIRGDYTAQLERAINLAFEQFFNTLPEVKKANLQCPEVTVCLTLNRDYRQNSSKLSFTYEHTATTLGPRIFRSTTRLQPLNDKILTIGDASALVADQGSSRPSLYNDGSSFETGLTVQEGDLLEITPSYLNVEQRQELQPQTLKTSNLKCIKESLTTVCDPVQTCILRHAPSESVLCPRNDICENILSCESYEDQFTLTTRYPPGISFMKKIENPIGQFQEIYEGLVLKFSFTSMLNGKPHLKIIECPLHYFQRDGYGNSLTVKIENQPNCEIFNKNEHNSPLLHLANKISFTKKFKTGTDVINWKGEILQNHQVELFHPQVGFGGTLRIRGYRIDSQIQSGL